MKVQDNKLTNAIRIQRIKHSNSENMYPFQSNTDKCLIMIHNQPNTDNSI